VVDGKVFKYISTNISTVEVATVARKRP